MSDNNFDYFKENILKPSLKENKTEFKTIDYSANNFNILFPRSRIETPLESVKFGGHQFNKFSLRERRNLICAVYETLTNPDIVLKEERLNEFAEPSLSHNYAKNFILDKDSKMVQSVIVEIKNENVIISSHERPVNEIVSKIKQADQILYLAPEVGSLIQQHTQNEQSVYHQFLDEILQNKTTPLNKYYDKSNIKSIENLLNDGILTNSDVLRYGEPVGENTIKQINYVLNKDNKSEFDIETFKNLPLEEILTCIGDKYELPEEATKKRKHIAYQTLNRAKLVFEKYSEYKTRKNKEINMEVKTKETNEQNYTVVNDPDFKELDIYTFVNYVENHAPSGFSLTEEEYQNFWYYTKEFDEDRLFYNKENDKLIRYNDNTSAGIFEEETNLLGMFNFASDRAEVDEMQNISQFLVECSKKLENNNEQSIQNYMLDKLKSTGIEVITDKDEFNRILEQEKEIQKMSDISSELDSLIEQYNENKNKQNELQNELKESEEQLKEINKKHIENFLKYAEKYKDLIIGQNGIYFQKNDKKNDNDFKINDIDDIFHHYHNDTIFLHLSGYGDYCIAEIKNGLVKFNKYYPSYNYENLIPNFNLALKKEVEKRIENSKIEQNKLISEIENNENIILSDKNENNNPSAISKTEKNLLVENLEKTAEIFIPAVFSRENYAKIFKDGIIETPIETVKLGNNQFVKLAPGNRNNLMLAIRQTIENPSLILEKETFDIVSEKIKPIHIYGKSFVNNENSKKTIESIIIYKDNDKIAISLHNKPIEDFVKHIKTTNDILYLDDAVSRMTTFAINNGGSLVLKEAKNLLSRVEQMPYSRLGQESYPLNPKYNKNSILSIKEFAEKNNIQTGNLEITKDNFDKYFNILNQHKDFKDNKNKNASELYNFHVKPENKEEMKKWLEDEGYKINEKNVKQFLINERENKVYGFAFNNKIYLNPDLMNSNVIAHEYTHLWDNYVQKTNPELWEKGKVLFKDTYLWEEIKNNKNYQDIKDDENLVLSECHSRIVGKMAKDILTMIEERDGKIAAASVIDWDKEISKYISNDFNLEKLIENHKDVNQVSFLAKDKVKEILKKTLTDFLSQPMKDLFSSKEIIREMENQTQTFKNSFFTDYEKMRDFQNMSKEAFLSFYSYLEEKDYNDTVKEIEYIKNECNERIKETDNGHILIDSFEMIDGSNRQNTALINAFSKQHGISINKEQAEKILEIVNYAGEHYPNDYETFYFDSKNGNFIEIEDVNDNSIVNVKNPKEIMNYLANEIEYNKLEQLFPILEDFQIEEKINFEQFTEKDFEILKNDINKNNLFIDNSYGHIKLGEINIDIIPYEPNYTKPEIYFEFNYLDSKGTRENDIGLKYETEREFSIEPEKIKNMSYEDFKSFAKNKVLEYLPLHLKENALKQEIDWKNPSVLEKQREEQLNDTYLTLEESFLELTKGNISYGLLSEKLLNAAQDFDKLTDDKALVLTHNGSGSHLLIDEKDDGMYEVTLFDYTNAFVDRDFFGTYKNAYNKDKDVDSKIEAGLIQIKDYLDKENLWELSKGDFYNFEINNNDRLKQHLYKVKNDYFIKMEMNNLEFNTKEELDFRLSESINLATSKPGVWNFLLEKGADGKNAVLMAAADAHLGENIDWFIDNLPEDKWNAIIKDRDLCKEILNTAKDSINSDTEFTVQPMLRLAEKLDLLEDGINYCKNLEKENIADFSQNEGFILMQKSIEEYSEKLDSTKVDATQSENFIKEFFECTKNNLSKVQNNPIAAMSMTIKSWEKDTQKLNVINEYLLSEGINSQDKFVKFANAMILDKSRKQNKPLFEKNKTNYERER